jgi:hypothetical protein
MNKSNPPTKHQSFLLRAWQDQTNQEQPNWRFSLEEVQTHQRRGFANLEELYAFLKAQLVERPNEDAQPSE